jgi:predicted Mrr-cat superfamily restriction endonuclease
LSNSWQHCCEAWDGGDGGIDIIAHKDELGFQPPVIKVQCKQTFATIGGPDVQRLLGAIQPNEHGLFVTLGDYSADAVRIERGKSNLRLISRTDLVQLIFNNYEKLDPHFKALLPLKQSFTPSQIQWYKVWKKLRWGTSKRWRRPVKTSYDQFFAGISQ